MIGESCSFNNTASEKSTCCRNGREGLESSVVVKEFSSEISEKLKNCSDNDTKVLSTHQELRRRSFTINEIFWIRCKRQELKRKAIGL